MAGELKVDTISVHLTGLVLGVSCKPVRASDRLVAVFVNRLRLCRLWVDPNQSLSCGYSAFCVGRRLRLAFSTSVSNSDRQVPQTMV